MNLFAVSAAGATVACRVAALYTVYPDLNQTAVYIVFSFFQISGVTLRNREKMV